MESNRPLKFFRFSALLQRDGWLEPAYVGVDEGGLIQYLADQPPAEGVATESVLGFALPGFQNAHSHAFQYAMTGLAEIHPAGVDDDFWSWREAMYKCALSLSPDQAEAVAAMLYAEMVRHGYTQVAEFHYLHHDQHGNRYANLAEMGERMVAAAASAGIKITLIPVFYQKGGFGVGPQPRQRRFISKQLDDYLHLLEASERIVKRSAQARLGASVHSLRAVDLADVKRTFQQIPGDIPFHLHVAEQKREVADCLAFCGQRPMEWLLENLPVNPRFHLVHSTHLSDDELIRLARTKANVVLCPSTEGNLGDGIFRMKEYATLDGRWSIGTDSHIGLNPLEEFRMIDYRQRLVTNKRNTFEGDAAHYLVNESVRSGRQSMGLSSANHFELGKAFDAVVYDAGRPRLAVVPSQYRLATLLYHHDSAAALGTLVNGRWIVKNQVHRSHAHIFKNYSRVVKSIELV